VVGGGLPLAAFGGRREIMSRLSPQGPVYQAGTLSGNPLAVQAGLATLRQLTPAVYERLEALGAMLESGIRPAVEAAGCSMTRVGSMFTIFFRSTPPSDFAQVGECDMAAFGRFHRAALDAGVYLPPSQYEAAFLAATLTDDELTHLIAGLRSALRSALEG
jgi:glutamate-1-semialdehyde 2,1-aminomutase